MTTWKEVIEQIRQSIEKTSTKRLIIRKKQPRRIVLEETGRYIVSHYSIDINDGNLILPPGREYKIVEEDNQCAE